MAHKTIMLLVLLVFASAPFVCTSGLLEHACPCDAQECDHEANCPSDPCSDLLRVDLCHRITVPALARIVSAPAPPGVREAGSLPAIGVRWQPRQQPPPGLPYPASDRPLLV